MYACYPRYRRPPAVRDNTKDFNDGGRAQVPHESIAPPKVSNIMMEGDDDKVCTGKRDVAGRLWHEPQSC